MTMEMRYINSNEGVSGLIPDCEIFFLLDGEPTHRKLGSKSHPTSRGFLSKVGPMAQIHIRLPNIVCYIIDTTNTMYMQQTRNVGPLSSSYRTCQFVHTTHQHNFRIQLSMTNIHALWLSKFSARFYSIHYILRGEVFMCM